MTFLFPARIAGAVFIVSSVFVTAVPNVAHALAQVSDELINIYQPPPDELRSTDPCARCHNEPRGGQSISNLNIFGRRVEPLIVPPSAFTPEADADFRDDIAEAIGRLEADFAPRIRSGTRTTLTLPRGASSISVDIDPGQTRSGTTASLVQSLSSAQLAPRIVEKTTGRSLSNISVALSGNRAVIDVSALSDEDRGLLRRNGGVEIDLVPVNNHGFKPTTEATRTANRLALSFENTAPIGVADFFGGDEGGVITGNVLTQKDVVTNETDRDFDGDGLSAVLVSGPSAGAFSTALRSDGGFEFQVPPAPSVGTITFSYKLVEDRGGLESDPVIVALVISPAPVSPPQAEDDAFQTDEDRAFTGNLLDANPATRDEVTAPPAEIDLQLVVGPSRGQVLPTLDTDGIWRGAFRYVPEDNANGPDTFTYALRDANAANGSDTARVDIDIKPLNDAPVANAVALGAINEAQGVQKLNLLDGQFVEDVDHAASALTVEGFVALGDPIVFDQDGASLTYDPVQFVELDDDESVTFTFRYRVRDADGALSATEVEITQKIVGLDNSLGRIAGEYANTLRGRYNRHFQPTSVQNASCHSCHNVGQVGVEIEDVSDCTEEVFNDFGFRICTDRDPGEPALVDLVRRLESREARFSPVLGSIPPLTINADASVDTRIGSPLALEQTGRTVDGDVAEVIDFAFFNTSGELIGARDSTRQFRVSPNGQISVAGRLVSGIYNLDVRPINDAGQRDGQGKLRNGVRGFFPTIDSLRKSVTIEVSASASIAVVDGPFNTDTVTPIEIEVLENDTGGDPDTVSIVTNGTKGIAVVNANDTVTYTPDGDETGTDTFIYRAENDAGGTDATVTVNIVPAGAPVAVDDAVQTSADEPVRIAVLSNDFGGAPDTIAISTAPGEGQAAVDGVFITFAPPDDFEGDVTLAYTSTNGVGASTAVITVAVSPVAGLDFENFTQNPALKSVARALGDSCDILLNRDQRNGAQQDLVQICGDLATDAISGGSIDLALDAIRNEEMLAASEVLSTAGRSIGGSVRQRLRETRGGAGRGLNTGGINFTVNNQTLSSAALDDLIGQLSGTDGEAFTSEGSATSPIGLFLSGDIVFSERDGSNNEAGFDLTSFNVAGGVDYAFSENFLLGTAVGYSRTDTDFSSGGGLESQSFHASLYGSGDNLLTPGLRLDGMVGGGVSSIRSDRQIRFTANGKQIDRTARADFNGHFINTFGRLSYDLTELAAPEPDATGPTDDLGLTVFVELDYLHARTSAYTETGAGGLSLRVDSTTFDSLKGAFGVRTSYAIDTGMGQVTPFVDLSGNSELLDSRPSVTSAFAAVGANAPTFTVIGDKADGLFGLISVGVNGDLLGSELSVSYTTSFGREFFSDHAISLSLGGPFVGADWLGLSLTGGFNGLSGADLQLGLTYDVKF